MSSYALSPDAPTTPTGTDLAAAREAVFAALPPTPLLELPESAYPHCRKGGKVWLKWEGAQPTGSFKVRGGLAAVAAAPAEATLVAASAGNHGLGLAWAARSAGRSAIIVLPDSAPQVKRRALETSGAQVVSGGPSYDTAETHALDLAASNGRYVSAYNNTAVIAGQATVVTEIERQLPSATHIHVVVPVGGGGLAAGCALAASPGTHITGVEAGPSRAISASIRARQHQHVEVGQTIADGLAGNIEPTSVTPAILASHHVPVLAAQEHDTQRAVVRLAETTGLIAEGSAVTPLAAWWAGSVGAHPAQDTDDASTVDTVFVVTGRNIDLGLFAALYEQQHANNATTGVSKKS